jgi:hypothetical protein
LERTWAYAGLSPRAPFWLAAPECRAKDPGRSQTAGTGVQIPMVLTSLWAQLLVAGTVHSRRPLFQSGFVMKIGEHGYSAFVRHYCWVEDCSLALCRAVHKLVPGIRPE